VSEVARRLDEVRERIAAACERAGRDPRSVRLVAVSKTMPAALVREAMAAGQTLFGENRVQEALAKIDETGPGSGISSGGCRRTRPSMPSGRWS
jgi:uncharacterized pyridoxal phosphate-containing UPF0001 family protein